jgi:hypothetical protein
MTGTVPSGRFDYSTSYMARCSFFDVGMVGIMNAAIPDNLRRLQKHAHQREFENETMTSRRLP